MGTIKFVVYCPRCDRPIERSSHIEAWDALKEHVPKNHPDYDPEWWDTYPNSPDHNVTQTD